MRWRTTVGIIAAVLGVITYMVVGSATFDLAEVDMLDRFSGLSYIQWGGALVAVSGLSLLLFDVSERIRTRESNPSLH